MSSETKIAHSAKIAHSVSAVIIVDNEILLIERQPWLSAFPGYFAFPGGAVEKEDDHSDHHWPEIADASATALNALHRELQEELGWELQRALNNDSGEAAVVSLGTAQAPAFAPRRFATRYFRVDLPEKPLITPEHGEIAGYEWVNASTLLKQWQAGERLIAPPTLAIIRGLAAEPDLTSTKCYWQDLTANIVAIEPIAGLRILPVPSNTLPPARHTNAFLIGDDPRQKILVDPSPRDEQTYAQLVAFLEQETFSALLITHHHADHNERADQLARHFNVPLLMSRYTKQRLSEVRSGFFNGVTIKEVSDGDTLCHWLGQPVNAIEVPGHDQGQLALAPKPNGGEPAWCIVGDLIQGIGTVVIAPPEGNMLRYFETMQAMIELNPAVIVPSHGLAMGSTFRLRATLEHRQAREGEILRRVNEGENEDEMLKGIYCDIDARLLPLARINIQSHLEKLIAEGKVSAKKHS